MKTKHSKLAYAGLLEAFMQDAKADRVRQLLTDLQLDLLAAHKEEEEQN
jgi:hypothetical protein